MFIIENVTENSLEKILIKNDVTGERVKIIPEFSGNLNELVLSNGKENISILDCYETREDSVNNPYFKGAVLLPFPNRLKNGKYIFEGKEYFFPVNDDLFNTAIHGFFYGRNMEIHEVVIEEKYCSVTLKNIYDSEYDYYPFNFTTYITYTLDEVNGFECLTQIINDGNKKLPVGLGWHPYISLGGSVNDYMLRIPPGKYHLLDKQMIPTGELKIESDFSGLEKIGQHNFNTGLILDQQEGKVFTEIHSPEKNVRVKFWQETGSRKFNYLQLYIPPERKSIALEPMTCNVDAFNNGEGLIVLNPLESFQASFGIQIS